MFFADFFVCFSNNADNLTERKTGEYILLFHHRNTTTLRWLAAAVEAMKKTPPTSGRAFTEYAKYFMS